MAKDQQLPSVSVVESQSVQKEIFPGIGFDTIIWIVLLFFLFGGTSIFGLGTKE
ncbi:hypothetical protein HNQ80_004923 [Anaerosolibacter carboniphilus]|uniref:Uncharacterized protein n=1 Tax=Anaerosolibacter carboniphilus TaxID=1417629 RepID=A0A841L2A2_9FIRM|nr:hypothetical protein [Anaerosolibacter carboniphilus]MBB6218748.1 hypothetical protein [Anaerosolibacter carboniphilus]